MVLGAAALLLLGLTASQLPLIGAALILHPPRRPVIATPPPKCQEVTLRGEGVTLQGWRGPAVGNRRGTLIYLHGIPAPPSTSPAPEPKIEKTSADALVLALAAEDFNVREQAEQSLAALGESALPVLQRNARSADPEIRMRVNRLLGLAGSGRLKRMFAARQKFTGFAADPSRHWPCLVEIKQYDAKTGRFEAQLEWQTLGSLVVIVGTLTDQQLVFTETRFIRNGNSMLNCVYTFNLKDANNQSATKIHGTWTDPTGARGGKVELSAAEN
jgi:hypothetical protein